VFDQGPYFHLLLLHKEKCISDKCFELGVNQLNQNIDKLILLSAPVNILYERVRTRAKDIRAKDMNFDLFNVFCNEYINSYNKLKKFGISIHKIDTNQISIKETLTLFNDIVHDR